MAVLRVKEPFSVDIKGAAFVFSSGQLVESTHPAVKGREHLFETVDQWMGRESASLGATVEQATAAPGEKRSVSKKAAPKSDA